MSTNLTSTICIAIPLLTPSSTEISKSYPNRNRSVRRCLIAPSCVCFTVLVRQMVRFGHPQTPQRGTTQTGGPPWAVQSTVAVQRRHFRHPSVDQRRQGLAGIEGVPQPRPTANGNHASPGHQPPVHAERRESLPLLQLYDVTIPEASVLGVRSPSERQSVRSDPSTQQARQYVVWGLLLKKKD